MKSMFDEKAIDWDTPEKIARAKIFADKIIENCSKMNNVSALEYGAGTGLVSFCLNNIFSEITLVDNSIGMLSESQKKIDALTNCNVSAINFDLTKKSLNKKYDAIYSLLTLHHIQDTKHILTQFYNHLNQDGKLLIADLDQEDGGFHGDGFDGHNGFNRDELVMLTKQAGFSNVRIETLTHINRVDLNQQYPIFVLIAAK